MLYLLPFCLDGILTEVCPLSFSANFFNLISYSLWEFREGGSVYALAISPCVAGEGSGRVEGVGQEGLGNPSFSCSLNHSEAASFLKEHNYTHIDYCIIINPSLISLVDCFRP